MANINDLKKYLNYEFSSGPYTGSDYLSFQTKYINYLKTLCKDNNWELSSVSKYHYCFSAFIKNSHDKYIYLSVSDVRFFSNEWYKHILIRTAIHEKDYNGGRNNFTTLSELKSAIETLFNCGGLL